MDVQWTLEIRNFKNFITKGIGLIGQMDIKFGVMEINKILFNILHLGCLSVFNAFSGVVVMRSQIKNIHPSLSKCLLI